jgi:hypothetical protein
MEWLTMSESNPDLGSAVAPLTSELNSTTEKKEDGLSTFFNVVKVLTFFSQYGSMLGIWSYYDTLVEILIMRELKLTPQQTSIVCGGLSSGPKLHILCSLLALKTENEALIGSLKHLQEIAERNSFAHGFVDYDKATGMFSLISRKVSFRHKVKTKSLDLSAFHSHIDQFKTKLNELLLEQNISMDQIAEYQKTISRDADGTTT